MGSEKLPLCKHISFFALPLLLWHIFHSILTSFQAVHLLSPFNWLIHFNQYEFYLVHKLSFAPYIYFLFFQCFCCSMCEKEKGGFKRRLWKGRQHGEGCFPFPPIWIVLSADLWGFGWFGKTEEFANPQQSFIYYYFFFFFRKTVCIELQAHMERRTFWSKQ